MLKQAHQRLDKGFTLVELLVVLAMVTVIATLSSVNLSGLISSTTFDESLELILSDFRRQQFRAISGQLQDGQPTFGIHFEPTSYILFAGTTYTPGLATNHVVPLPPNIVFENISFPSGNILFTPSSGEVIGYTEVTDTVTVTHTNSGESQQLEFNILGVIELL